MLFPLFTVIHFSALLCVMGFVFFSKGNQFGFVVRSSEEATLWISRELQSLPFEIMLLFHPGAFSIY